MPFDGTTFEKHDIMLERLWLARERLSRRGGWCQGEMRFGNAYCVLGAVVVNGKMSPITFRDISAVLYRALPINYEHGIIKYNDTPGRTQAESVAWLDRAIALLESEL